MSVSNDDAICYAITTSNVDYISAMNLMSGQQFEKGVMALPLEEKYANTVSL